MTDQELLADIKRLKKERNAVILAHTYQPGVIQDVADFVGDSYGLSVKVSQLEGADMIVFCGVRFMAETAAILNPEKVVLMPAEDAGCPMAEMINAKQLMQFKAEHPGAIVMCYVNSTAEVKAESDICCTSSNAEKIVRKLDPNQEILFVPDQHLGGYVRDLLHHPMVLWNGYCPAHQKLKGGMLRKLKAEYPGAKVMVHPETAQEVRNEADYVLSTGQMLDEVAKAPAGSCFIVGTETGIMHALQKANPDKKFIAGCPELVCDDMKKVNLLNLRDCMVNVAPRIVVDPEIARKARISIEAMLRLSK